MRMAMANTQLLYYALYGRQVPIYDYYTDSEGNQIPIDTGETKTVYENPVKFFGNISFSGGEAQAVEFGNDLSSYSAVLITPKGYLPIDETSRIWFETEPIFDEEGNVNEFSADYTVAAVKPSLNYTKYLLKKIVK